MRSNVGRKSCLGEEWNGWVDLCMRNSHHTKHSSPLYRTESVTWTTNPHPTLRDEVRGPVTVVLRSLFLQVLPTSNLFPILSRTRRQHFFWSPTLLVQRKLVGKWDSGTGIPVPTRGKKTKVRGPLEKTRNERGDFGSSSHFKQNWSKVDTFPNLPISLFFFRLLL